MVVVRPAGEAWLIGGEVGRRRSVGRLLASSIPVAAERGKRGSGEDDRRGPPVIFNLAANATASSPAAIPGTAGQMEGRNGLSSESRM